MRKRNFTLLSNFACHGSNFTFSMIILERVRKTESMRDVKSFNDRCFNNASGRAEEDVGHIISQGHGYTINRGSKVRART